MIRYAGQSRARSLAYAIALAALAGCASARPERQLQVTTETGRLVPLDSVTIAYTVGGVHVIQRPNFANDVVAVHLYLLGGRRQLTPATQGIEDLLLRVSEHGTASYPGDAARRAWARTGSDLLLEPEDDWTLFGFRAVRPEFDSSWSVLADRLMHPTLAAASVALVRNQMLDEVRSRAVNPDAHISDLADSIAFAGHAYGLEATGTLASLPVLDSAALAAYVQREMVTSRMLLVVVGNISRQSVERAVSATLGTLPAGHYVWTLPSDTYTPLPIRPAVLEERHLATNYVLGVFTGPPASSPDYPAFRVATALLGAFIHDQVRTQRGLSYAAYAPFYERATSAGGIYFTTGLPDRVLDIIKGEVTHVRRMQSENVDMSYFTDQFIFDYLANNASDDAQADFLARAQLYEGDYRKASDEMEELRHVTTSRVRAAAQRYFNHVQFVYVGDTTRVTRKAFAAF